MEQTTIKLKLVDSEYSLEDAQEIIHQLLSDKIKFLKRKRLSSLVNFERDTGHITKRLQELDQAKEDLQEFINGFENGDKIFEISCPLEIKMKSKSDKRHEQEISSMN